ncbi:30S ribosomal protein S13 [Methanonatronarchaeum sp. AMET-Sl]|uniref:30S ribosomal protein S13 n=1 Tax=Methanonatronarchaeum sp. AMET-Sl TaxID=3037654 RepID=UPI00244E58C4|nr:30S ribosomal protein S13 [Methanonatronarchaeum sp. AMET-Sl]WGI17209.1 30S ribosomal protein S13 [Methanonatronarchaeum sp. AMET-Sl]
MSDSFRHIVRIKNTNIEGDRRVDYALTGIKGIGQRTAKAITKLSGINPEKRLGTITDEEVEKIEQSIDQLEEKAPGWFVNRTKDYKTGENKHVTGSDLIVTHRQDLDRMKKINCYKGVRHKKGKKVRGQRTRSTGRSETTVGVKRAELQKQKDKAEEE